MVWDDKPLFKEKIEAWINGPVVRELFEAHRGQFKVYDLPSGDPEALSAAEKETVKAVLDYYGDKNSQYLSDLTHLEDPWKNARIGIPANSRGEQEITHRAMADYYSGILVPEAE